MKYLKLLIAVLFILYQGIAMERVDREIVYVDALHGYSIQKKPHWSIKVMGNAIVLSKEEKAFVLIRGINHKGDLKQVARSWMSERSLMDGGRARYAFKQTTNAIFIAGEGLGFPHFLSPMSSVNAGLTGKMLPDNFKELTVILPGKATALVISFIYLEELDDVTKREMLDMVRSLNFLPLDKRVGWREEIVKEPQTGMEAFRIHVPKGFQFNGGVIKMGTKGVPFYKITKGDISYGTDYIDVETHIIQSPYGSNAQTLLNINGAASQQPQIICITDQRDIVRLYASILRAAFGVSWNISNVEMVPLTPDEKRIAAMSPPMLAGVVKNEMVKLTFILESDRLKRVGYITGGLLVAQNPHYAASTQDCYLSTTIISHQFPKEEEKQAMALVNGMSASFLINPQFSLYSLQRFVKENRELNRMVREMVQKHREDNTRMARTWSNLLSDQTYIKDPQTNEIYRVHKNSWETGNFWREPIFGDVILGGVKEGSKLEELLRTKGWRLLNESLEGFPEMWK